MTPKRALRKVQPIGHHPSHLGTFVAHLPVENLSRGKDETIRVFLSFDVKSRGSADAGPFVIFEGYGAWPWWSVIDLAGGKPFGLQTDSDDDVRRVRGPDMRDLVRKLYDVADKIREEHDLEGRSSGRDPLFIGVFPAGISYADRTRSRHGDYLQVAFLPYDTLALEYRGPKVSSDMRASIEKHAASLQARKGQTFQVSAAGQTVKLGGRVAGRARGRNVGQHARHNAGAANENAFAVAAASGPNVLEVGGKGDLGRYRVQRFSTTVRVTDLTNAGKRGKTVNQIAIHGLRNEALGGLVATAALVLAQKNVPWDRMVKNMEHAAAMQDAEVEKNALRGIDVVPQGKKFVLQGAYVHIDADPTSILLGYRHNPMEPLSDYYLCGVREKRLVRPAFEWLVKNRDRVKRMRFRELYDALQADVGVRLDCH
jgi:hypothetical protein